MVNKKPLGKPRPSSTLNGRQTTQHPRVVMMIFATSLPRFKAFLGDALQKSSDISCCLLFLSTFLLPAARRSVTSAAGSVLEDVRNAGWLLRWLGSSQAPQALLQAAQHRLLMEARCQPNRLHVLAIDSSQHGQQGQHTQNTFSRGNTKSRPKKSQRHQNQVHRRSCHCFVFALLLTPCGLRIPYWLPFYTKEFCEIMGRKHLSQASLAAQLIDEIPLPAHSRVVVVGDTAFEAKQVRRSCARRGWQWVVPLNPERRLAGERDRVPVRSVSKQLTANEFRQVSFRLDQGDWAKLARVSPQRCQSRKQTRTYWVHHRIAAIHNIGEVALLFSSKQNPTPGGVQVQKLLISNAVQASTEELLGWYSLRWQIELFFRECKSELGLCQYKLGPFRRVIGWVNLSVAAYCYLEGYRWQKQREAKKPERELWQRVRTQGLKEKIRQQVQRNEVQTLLNLAQSSAGQQRLQDLLQRMGESDDANVA
jgi:hypothetical protein